MVSNKKVIGQKDEATQEEIIDEKNNQDVSEIFFNMGQFKEGDLCGWEGHDQNKGR